MLILAADLPSCNGSSLVTRYSRIGQDAKQLVMTLGSCSIISLQPLPKNGNLFLCIYFSTPIQHEVTPLNSFLPTNTSFVYIFSVYQLRDYSSQVCFRMPMTQAWWTLSCTGRGNGYSAERIEETGIVQYVLPTLINRQDDCF